MTELQTVQALAAIRQRIATLTPLAVAARHAELQRAGHGSQSMGEPSRQSETTIPVGQRVLERDDDGNPTRWGPIGPSDPIDRELKQRAKRYTKHLIQALAELDAAFDEQGWWLNAVDEAEIERDLPCANFAQCGRYLEKGRKTGECGGCRKWRHDHDSLPYPQKRGDDA